ncbi:hypothetical protein ACFE04_025910 [Oxalis oulophora]
MEMASHEQQQEAHNAAMNLDCSDESNKDRQHDDPSYQVQKPGWRKFLSYVGPGFLVSMAYLDPGNLETDLQAGANHRYELLWVTFIGLLFALIIQSLAANLGVSTGKHLSELCKTEYPNFVKHCLWIVAELAVIAADIPEVVGTAFALNILLNFPLWAGVISTGVSTLLILGLQKYGVRKLEMVIAVLVFAVAACFIGEVTYVKPPPVDVLKGVFVPTLRGHQATADAIALLGALVMPHNLFLHSALVLSRKVPNSVRDINEACRYFLIESGFALLIAFTINIAVISVSGTVCYSTNISQEISGQCNNLTLNSASFLLKNVLGKSSSIIYAIALLASGQSSALTGTYAGQYIMQGFLDMKMKRWVRNLITRSMAIIPSLIVSIINGPPGAGQLIIVSSIMVISWTLGVGIIGINIYYLSTGLVSWLIHNNLPRLQNVFLGMLVFPLMATYIVAVAYLMFRKDTAVTFIQPIKPDILAHDQIENGL